MVPHVVAEQPLCGEPLGAVRALKPLLCSVRAGEETEGAVRNEIKAQGTAPRAARETKGSLQPSWEPSSPARNSRHKDNPTNKQTKHVQGPGRLPFAQPLASLQPSCLCHTPLLRLFSVLAPGPQRRQAVSKLPTPDPFAPGAQAAPATQPPAQGAAPRPQQLTVQRSLTADVVEELGVVGEHPAAGGARHHLLLRVAAQVLPQLAAPFERAVAVCTERRERREGPPQQGSAG